MPGARAHLEPAAAARDRSASDEAELLERSLQTEFEEDVARIFDESLYSDLELVCGRSKVKTHSCILKARTHKFYRKLDKILHVDINRNTYDEIYSFISDAYTECNIRHQEKEIIQYLNEHLEITPKETKLSQSKDKEHTNKSVTGAGRSRTPEPDGFLTPLCASPGADKYTSISSSPSIELKKEYYALVPIESNILEKELKEQDVLSNAFQFIKKSQCSDNNKKSTRNKPTSLSITTSHSSKNFAPASLNARLNKETDTKLNPPPSQTSEGILQREARVEAGGVECERGELSPDSLASAGSAAGGSSSSDYLSAANLSPATSSAPCHSLINAESEIKMDNVFTSSDSGLDSSHLLESLNGQRDVTLTDVSLSESTLHDLTIDEASHTSSPLPEHAIAQRTRTREFIPCPVPVTQSSSGSGLYSESAGNPKPSKYMSMSSKEEKQRQNEEIVILESSSLSSETGSWEPVFAPRHLVKDCCISFLTNERNTEYANTAPNASKPHADVSNQVQVSPFKSKFCFIDASSLVDDDEDRIKLQADILKSQNVKDNVVLPAPSQPMPCAANKHDASPDENSESHDHDDSLEQADGKNPDYLQKDLSPTIFDMTPITEDSLSTNPFEVPAEEGIANQAIIELPKAKVDQSSRERNIDDHILVSNTPHNSMMTVRPIKQTYSEDGDSDSSYAAHHEARPSGLRRMPKFTEGSPIVSGGASIEDHLPQVLVGSPLARRKIDNVPIVSGAYIHEDEPTKHVRKSPKSICAPAWVVDMSDADSNRSMESLKSSPHKRPEDRACQNLRSESKYSNENISKSRSSVESDSSERSGHKFYIDLASLPAPAPPAPAAASNTLSEKKNIFSMYIDLGENNTLKEMPARLSSSLNAKKQSSETKSDKTLSKSSTVTKSSTQNKAIAIFERYEALCSNPDISITEIISMPEVTSKANRDTDTDQKIKTTMLSKETVNNKKSSDLFVRLSDLDKPSPKKLLDSANTIYEHSVSDVRMTRSIPESGWEGRGRADVISSFHSENAASLNRLFPHLRTEFSRSMPGSLARGRSPPPPPPPHQPAVADHHPSDLSEISSVQSSYCRSLVENSTTEESQSQTSSLIGSCQSKLGQDLLRMFLEEIAPDVVVEVSGKRFKAHKCILSSRCQYFAGILSGGWVESAGNVITLPPFSYNVVHFALCHIYSGLSTIPDSISILELATIADMLGLEGLKEAIMFTLKAKYCHHFHKPCSVCTAGVLECFPLSSVYGLDDLYRKCLRWITKHFHKVWPTKAFATLPKELLDKCYQQHIINMSMDNVIDTVCACGITEASLVKARWAECVGGMCRRLVAAAAQFMAPRAHSAVRAAAALPAALPPPAAAALDAALAAALDQAPPDETCRTYAFLSYLANELKSQQAAKQDLVSHGEPQQSTSKSSYLWARAGEWRARCERSLVRAPRAADCAAFRALSPGLRARLHDLGCLSYTALSPRSHPAPRTLAVHSKHSSASRIDIDHVRTSFVPYAAKPTFQSTLANEIKARTRKATSYPPKIRTTKAQEERAKFNMAQTNLTSSNKNLSKPVKFENAKPRYLQPRAVAAAGASAGAGAGTGAGRLAARVLSSSEVSRNTSPVLARAGGAGGAGRAGAAAGSRPRTAEPSTDSLSESQTSNKYATYTKSKHAKGSLDSTKSSSQQTISATKTSARTKIPVYLRHAKSSSLPNSQLTNGSYSNTKSSMNSSNSQSKQRVSGSLMMATKSSSAKMVARSSEPPGQAGAGAARPARGKRRPAPAPASAPAPHPPPDIPPMERSGTFLKDEPTFADKTTNIDAA